MKAAIAMTAFAALIVVQPSGATTASGATDMTVGYRQDDFNWNIASDITGTATPNILSELTWSDLRILQLKIDSNHTTPSRWHFRVGVAMGMIADGKNQDSDYLGDNRTAEFSRSNNGADTGDTKDASLAIGYSVGVGHGFVIPMVGYSYHNLELHMTDGNQTVATSGITPPIGPFEGLNSKYEATWKGFWSGIEVGYRSESESTFFARYERHKPDYEAEADWNLRGDFKHPKSYEHIAKGRGNVFSFGARVNNQGGFSYVVSLDIQKWRAGPGIDRTFFANGAITEIRLNEVDWRSKALNFGLFMGI